MIYGYCRVSSKGQEDNNSLEQQQQEILEKYPTAKIIEEQYTGKTTDRPKFNELIADLKKGDILVITKLDRFARSTQQGLDTVNELLAKGVSVHVLNVGFMDNTPASELIRTIFLAFAQFERAMIVERTQEGKAIAKANAKANNTEWSEGRPKKFKNHVMELAIQEFENGESTYADIDRKYGISKSTLYRAIKKRKAEQLEQQQATE